MIDTATSRSSEPSVSWIVAYALGLAYSENTDRQRLRHLVEVTRGHPGLLVAARRRLAGSDVAERSMGDDAIRLLDRAAASAVEHRGPVRGGQGPLSPEDDHALP
jgi:hypothetical protein